MTDRVAISNLALSKLGEDDQLRDPEDDTKPARTIRVVWDSVRRTVLRAHPWNFALKRASLAALDLTAVDNVGIEPYPYLRAFERPGDWLRAINLLDDRWIDDRYTIEGGWIYSDDTGPLRIRYVADIVDTDQWDASFVEAFACRLAYQIADRITGDRGRRGDMAKAYEDALAEARGVDAQENLPEALPPCSWELARYL